MSTDEMHEERNIPAWPENRCVLNYVNYDDLRGTQLLYLYDSTESHVPARPPYRLNSFMLNWKSPPPEPKGSAVF